MPITKICKHCSKEFDVPSNKEHTAKFCSKKCKWDHHGWSSEPNTECTHCKKLFHLKESAKRRYKRNHGFFCSNVCHAKFKKEFGLYDGNKNPNYRGRTHDGDGYVLRTYVPHLVSVNGLRRMKLHQAVCCEILGVTRIGSGLHIHHRDCDVLNNDPKNLCVLSIADHKWIHKQFGNATLWAHAHGKVKTKTLCSWSDDKERAERILDATVLKQKASEIGVVKGGELLGSLEEGNQQPSLARNSLEGSETSSRVLTGFAEDSNAATSALH